MKYEPKRKNAGREAFHQMLLNFMMLFFLGAFVLLALKLLLCIFY